MILLILYPKSFNVSPKFDRKLANILKSNSPEEVCFPQDDNGLICRYFLKQYPTTIMRQMPFDAALTRATHSIVFDDGEEFPDLTRQLINMGVELRKIKVSVTRVVNIKKEQQYSRLKSTPEYEYIGRGSYWGNPYSMHGTGDDREEVIRKYKYDFDFEKLANREKSEVYKLAGKRLGCFCSPLPCHGDVLADFLNQWDDGA